MPIKGLSEDVRMPRLGKIHLGYKHPEKGYPVKTDYFVLPKDHSDYEKLVKAFGEKPKELRVLIPVEDEELWASQYYKAYDMTRGLICKGDGEMAMRMLDVKTGALADKKTETVTMKEWTCAGKECPEYQTKKCGETMNLRFILPEVPGLGVWQIDTGSINSILNINSCAKIIKRAFGRISMVPLILALEPIQVNNPETGKKQTVFVLNLRSQVTMAQLADSAREQAKTFLLESPDWEDVMEQKSAEDIEILYGDGEQSGDKATGEIKEKVQTESDKDFDELKSASKGKTADPEKKETGKFQQAEPATNPPEVINGVNMVWLKESLKRLNWKRVIIDYLKPQFGCLSATVSGCLLEMKEEQVKQFITEIKERLKGLNPEDPPDNIPF